MWDIALSPNSAVLTNLTSNLDTEFFVYPRSGTDWQDEVFEDQAAIYSVNFSASGGTEKMAYSGGISYLNQDGIVNPPLTYFEVTKLYLPNLKIVVDVEAISDSTS